MPIIRKTDSLVNLPIYQGSNLTPSNTSSIKVVLVLTDANKDIIFNNSDAVIGFGSTAQLPRKGLTKIDITNFVTDLQWHEAADQKWLDATVVLDNKGDRFSFVPRGARLEIYRRIPLSSSKSKLVNYFTIFVWERNYAVDGGAENLTWACYDRLYWVANTTVFTPIKYLKDKKSHKKGYTLQQIVKDVGQRFNIPIGVIETKAVPLASTFVIGGTLGDELMTKGLKQYLTISKDKSKYIWDMHDGNLNLREVTTISSKTNIYFFPDASMIENFTREEQSVDLDPSTAEKNSGFYTQIVVPAPAAQPGTTKNAKGKLVRRPKKYKTFTVNPTDPTIQKNFGIIPFPINSADGKTFTILGKNYTTKAEIQKAAQTQLDEFFSKPVQHISFDTRGVAGIWAGDSCYLNSTLLNAKGVFTIMSVGYELQADQLTLTIDTVENQTASLTESQIANLIHKSPPRY